MKKGSQSSDNADARLRSGQASPARTGVTPAAPLDHTGIDFRVVFERAADAMLIADSRGRYVNANPAACELTGYPRDELLAMSVGDLTIPAERAEALARFDDLLQKGRTTRMATIIRKDGTSMIVELHGIAMENGLYQGIIRDISDRVAAQEQLQRSLEAYSTLVETCHAAVISAGPDGRISSWNQAAQIMLGYSNQEAMGLPITRLVPDRYRDVHLAAFEKRSQASLQERFGRTIETEALCKDGTEVPIELSVAMARAGTTRLFTAVIRDISEQRAMVAKLHDALQRLQFHIERMPLAYILWDTGFHILEWNPSAERMFGYTRDEVIGKPGIDLIMPSDSVFQIKKVWSALLGGSESQHAIHANVRKDGSRLTGEWFHTPLRDAAGRICSVASMATDISEREVMDAQLRNAQKLESLGVMAAGIAHDFNSSLMVILGNSALLRSVHGLPARAIEHIELIEEAGSRADQLIKHLLAYARTGRHNPQITHLNEMIHSALKFLQSSLGQNWKIDLRLADRLATIRADHSQLEQIILNLCLNAKHAMEQGGTITITTGQTSLTPQKLTRCVPHDEKPGLYVTLAVEDTGCGMDPAIKTRIFDPFFTTSPRGHGLGLAAVLGILRQHHAVALVDSVLGRGTNFQVCFPVVEPAPAPPAKRPRTSRKR